MGNAIHDALHERPDRHDMFAFVFCQRRRYREDIYCKITVAKPRDLAASLTGKDAKLDDRAEWIAYRFRVSVYGS